MKVIMDLEANGLLGTATVLHCAVFKDIETKKAYKFVGWSSELEDFLNNCTVIIAHNGIEFDIPFLELLHGWKPAEGVLILDTLVMSRLLNPDRPRVEGTFAPHGVEAWGKRLGRWKPDHEDWSTFSPAMLHRCTEDVEIQFLIYLTLCNEADIKDPLESIFDPANYVGHNWAEAFELEHKSAYIIAEQGRNGCYFDLEKAEEYVEVLTDIINTIDSEVLQHANKTPKQKGTSVSKPFKNNGEPTKMVMDWYGDTSLSLGLWIDMVAGPFTRIEWEELNIGSEKQLKAWLYTMGWEPDEWNFSKTQLDMEGNPLRTSPKITETSLEKLPHGIGKKLVLRSKSRHRRSQIQGLIDNTRDDHRIPAEANSLGTPTGRMRHRKVANIPSANIYENKEDKNDPKNGTLVWHPEKQDTFFGTEMRSLFCNSPGTVLVGRDASGLELRCFAHYLNDDEYTDVVLSGDIHTHNQKLAGLDKRSQAKTFIYAFLYGAGQEKLGSIVHPDACKQEKVAEGRMMQTRFLEANPKLGSLVKGVKKASGRGWLKGIDGRKLMMRTFEGQVQKNKALNTLLQGAGAQIMTYARVWLYEEIKKRPELSSAKKVLDYHDEETWECAPEVAEQLKELMVQSVVEAGKHFKFNIPLDADARIGKNWAEIH